MVRHFLDTEFDDNDLALVGKHIARFPHGVAFACIKRKRVDSLNERGDNWTGGDRHLRPLTNQFQRSSNNLVVANDVGTAALRQSYQQYERGELLQLVVDRDVTLEGLRHDLQQERRRYAKAKNARDDLRHQLAETHTELNNLSNKLFFRNGGENNHISMYGGYALALGRNVSHTGAKSATTMITADRGEIKRKMAVMTYEHKAAVAKSIRACDFYKAATSIAGEATSVPGTSDAPSTTSDSSGGQAEAARSSRDAAEHISATCRKFNMHCYKGDATHEHAVEKKKIHVSVCSSALCDFSEDPSVLDSSTSEKVELANRTRWHKIACKLEEVDSHLDGKRCYDLVKRQIASIGLHNWETAHEEANAFHMYAFGLDGGPDNIGMNGRMKSALKGVPNI